VIACSIDCQDADPRSTCLHITPQARAALVLELAVGRYSPIQAVPRVTCPILFVAATEDVLCPVDQVHRAVKLAQHGTLLSRECTHFELYRGALFEGLIDEQVQFFRRCTGLAA
jgi:pimeloyl-ACP methyl ester carboxylesterase